MSNLFPDKLTLILITPLTLVSGYLSYRVHFGEVKERRSRFTLVAAACSFFCFCSLVTQVFNYYFLEYEDAIAITLRLIFLVLGMICNDVIVIHRMQILDGKKSIFAIFYGLTSCTKILAGVATIILGYDFTLTGSLSYFNSMGIANPVLVYGEMVCMIIFILFWVKLLASKKNLAEVSKVGYSREIKLQRRIIGILIVCACIVIVLWSLGVGLVTPALVPDFFWLPAYFFALCPSAIICLARDQLRRQDQSSQTQSQTQSAVLIIKKIDSSQV